MEFNGRLFSAFIVAVLLVGFAGFKLVTRDVAPGATVRVATPVVDATRPPARVLPSPTRDAAYFVGSAEVVTAFDEWQAADAGHAEAVGAGAPASAVGLRCHYESDEGNALMVSRFLGGIYVDVDGFRFICVLTDG